MSERDRLEHHPWRKSFVNDLARQLDELVGPRWIGYHYGVSVPDAALFARVVESESGRMVLAGVLLLGDAITADQLRKVQVAAIENSVNLTKAGTAEDREPWRAELDKLPPLARTDGIEPEDFSRLVAEHYKVWAHYVPHPAAAMAAQAKVKPPTVHTWIREARLRGFLPPARRGKG